MPNSIPAEEGRRAFGSETVAYDDARPDYPEQIYQIVCGSQASATDSVAFEIGAGTGEATKHLLSAAYEVVAIEPDERLAVRLGEKLGKPGVALRIEQSTFEEVELPASSFDLGVAATSLHWLRPDTALSKACQLLRPGGSWAMWWTVFDDPDNLDRFQRLTQPLFEGMSRSPSQGETSRRPFALDKQKRIAELRAAGFTDIDYREIRWNPVFSTQQILRLTSTFSSVSRLPDVQREQFLREIARIADQEFGGIVTRNFVTPIYTARKAG